MPIARLLSAPNKPPPSHDGCLPITIKISPKPPRSYSKPTIACTKIQHQQPRANNKLLSIAYAVLHSLEALHLHFSLSRPRLVQLWFPPHLRFPRILGSPWNCKRNGPVCMLADSRFACIGMLRSFQIMLCMWIVRLFGLLRQWGACVGAWFGIRRSDGRELDRRWWGWGILSWC